MSNSSGTKFSSYKINQGEVKLNVFLKGILNTPFPIISKLTNKPLIFSQYYLTDLFSNQLSYLIP